jgi:hypothetical protein
MTDRELLEAAAKAAGIEFTYWHQKPARIVEHGDHLTETRFWNPLTDDGDALRLAVKLELQLDLRHSFHTVRVYGAAEGRIDESGDPYAATRRAIVRAAAAIGRSKT